MVTGNIGSGSDFDWFKVELEAGVAYVIDLEGEETGKGTLENPYLGNIRNPDRNSISNASNDDGGEGNNARVTLTPTATGTHYVPAGAAMSKTGTYTLWVTRQDSERAGEDLPADTTTTGEVDVGGSATGDIGTAGDVDWFKVELVAYVTYVIDLEGDETSKGTLEDPFLGDIRDSVGNSLPGTENDDGGEGLNARLTFTPTAPGTYYVAAVSSVSSQTGTYTLSVTTKEIPPSDAVWSGTVTVGEIVLSGETTTGGYGYVASGGITSLDAGGSLSDPTFTVGMNNYTIDGLMNQTFSDNRLLFSLTAALSAADLAKLALHLGSDSFSLSDGVLDSASHTYSEASSTLDWSSTTSVQLWITDKTNAKLSALSVHDGSSELISSFD